MFSAIIVMLIIGVVLGTIIGIASILFHVEADTRVEDITNMLPGFNCGACGYPGCVGFAEALVERKEHQVSKCIPSKADDREKIAEYLNSTPQKDDDFIKIIAD